MSKPVLPGDVGTNPELKILNLRMKMACSTASEDDVWMKRMSKFITSADYSVYILDIKADKVNDKYTTTYAVVKELDGSCKFMQANSAADGSHFKVHETFYAKEELSKGALKVCDGYQIDSPKSPGLIDDSSNEQSFSPWMVRPI